MFSSFFFFFGGALTVVESWGLSELCGKRARQPKGRHQEGFTIWTPDWELELDLALTQLGRKRPESHLSCAKKSPIFGQ